MGILQPVIWSKGTFLSPQHMQIQDRFTESVLQFRLEALQFRPWGEPLSHCRRYRPGDERHPGSMGGHGQVAGRSLDDAHPGSMGGHGQVAGRSLDDAALDTLRVGPAIAHEELFYPEPLAAADIRGKLELGKAEYFQF